MKRLMSALFAVLLFVTMTPLNALATENESSEYDELIELACEVFPEYASAIRGENVNTYALPRSADSIEVIYRETRTISDTESMSISLLANGDAIVIDCKNYDITYTSSTTDINSVGIAGTATFTVAYDGYTFVLSNVAFTIYEYADDYFTNTGTVTQNSFQNYSKDASTSSTRIRYNITVSTGKTFDFNLYFKNNQLIAQA